MAQSTNTFDRYDVDDNVREDLSGAIYNISPTEVPFTSNVSREKSRQTYKEWQIDSLADAADNEHVDGDEFSGIALTNADRLGNFHQISRKDLVVSRRANIVNKAGRRSEMAYQIAKAGKELKRDIERAALLRRVGRVGDSGTAPRTAGVAAWIRSNISRGASGTAPTLSSGTPNAVGTAGTARGLTELQFLTASKDAYEGGGSPNMLMVPPRLKQGLSNFLFAGSGSRVAAQRQDQGKSPRSGVSVVGAVDVYVTDFQVIDIVPNRFSPAGSSAAEAFMLDTEYWALSYLDGYHVENIAKVGDHQRRMLIADWSVVSKNEEASAIVADINDTTAVAAGS